MEIKKIDNFTSGYRKGVKYALKTLSTSLGFEKIIDGKLRIPLKLFFEAALNNIDSFMDYGDRLKYVYREHDKKGIPQKIEISMLHLGEIKEQDKIEKLLYGGKRNFFDEAFKAMREGKTVYRRSYPWAKYYIENGNIFIKRGEDVSLCIELPEVIITADDWEVLE